MKNLRTVTENEYKTVLQAVDVVDYAGILVMELIRKHKIKGYDQFTCPHIRNLAKSLKVFG